ncbi:DUF397 domain-containing protein [Nocardia sp. NBC_00416]|uniref:DUF397 domain-containing protein n=1 Tax=Nocardia sp. NBC_00416 TaxID=2975991 RepID=UPI003FA573B8
MNSDLSAEGWFKSSYSTGAKDCVEVAHLGGDGVGVRDSKNPEEPALIFTPREWDSFVAAVQDAELDRW